MSSKTNKMIDTVILKIPREDYKVFNPAMFKPNINVIYERGCFLVKCVNNPTKKDKELGAYKPKLTAIKRMTKNGTEIPLKIEFSAPKILYGNNLDELDEKDFDLLAKTLSEKLYEMGVIVEIENIKNGDVSGFHASKNILLKEYTSSFVIKELTKINLSQRLDLDVAHFRNTGESVQYYTNSYSLIFYDKMKDLKKQPKRAIDKDQNFLQSSLFDSLNKDKKEILRVEARLTKRVKMNSFLVSIGCKKNPKFKDIFNKELCQKILTKCWREFVEDQNLYLFSLENEPEKVFLKILDSTDSNVYTRSTSLFALNFLCKELGVRKFRSMIEKNIDNRTWYNRVSKDLKKLDKILGKQLSHDWVKQVVTALEEFQPYKINQSQS